MSLSITHNKIIKKKKKNNSTHWQNSKLVQIYFLPMWGIKPKHLVRCRFRHTAPWTNYQSKFRHLTKLTCKVTLRQVVIRVYRLDIHSQSCWYFRPSFVNCCPSNPLSVSTIRPFPVWISILYTVYTRIQTNKHLPQSPLTDQFFVCRHFTLPSVSLIFLAPHPFNFGKTLGS